MSLPAAYHVQCTENTAENTQQRERRMFANKFNNNKPDILCGAGACLLARTEVTKAGYINSRVQPYIPNPKRRFKYQQVCRGQRTCPKPTTKVPSLYFRLYRGPNWRLDRNARFSLSHSSGSGRCRRRVSRAHLPERKSNVRGQGAEMGSNNGLFY